MAEFSIDRSALITYLSENINDSIISLKKIHNGVNLTILVSTAQGSREYILRKPTGIRNLEVFNNIHQEYTLMNHLRAMSIPAPEPILLCENKSIGGPFILMPYIDEGKSQSTAPLLNRALSQRVRNQVAICLANTLSKIHLTKVDNFSDVCNSKTLEEHLSSIIERIMLSKSNTECSFPHICDIIERLNKNIPNSPDMALVHRDYRPSNVIFTGLKEPKIVGILDWETALVSDPLIDLGYLTLHWNGISQRNELSDINTKESINKVVEKSESSRFSFQPEYVHSSTQKLLSHYERRTGNSVENICFYESLAALDLAAIWGDMLRYQSKMNVKLELKQRINYVLKTANTISLDIC